jgi:XTP/dITP diphosphohydrolase
MPEVVEDGETFEANAIKKAAETCRFTGLWTLADDSGLEVTALGLAPGVLSARYAGEPVSYEANNRKLLRELEGAPDRSARFRCVIALAAPDGMCGTVEGVCRGRIAETAAGAGGFGYDPLFIPDGETRTFSQMPAMEKNLVSHRGRALQAAAAAWRSLLLEGR